MNCMGVCTGDISAFDDEFDSDELPDLSETSPCWTKKHTGTSWDELPDLCETSPSWTKKHTGTSALSIEVKKPSSLPSTHKRKKECAPLSVKKLKKNNAILSKHNEEMCISSLSKEVQKSSSILSKESGKKYSSLHSDREGKKNDPNARVPEISASAPTGNDGKKRISLSSKERDKKKDRRPSLEHKKSTSSLTADVGRKSISLPSGNTVEKTIHSPPDDTNSILDSANSADGQPEHLTAEDAIAETENLDSEDSAKQMQLLLEGENLLMEFVLTDIGTDSEDGNDVELCVVTAVHPPTPNSAKPTSICSGLPDSESAHRECIEHSGKKRRRRINSDKEKNDKTFRKYAQDYNLKKCSIVITNVKDMSPRVLQSEGVYSLKRLFRKYEKSQRLEDNIKKLFYSDPTEKQGVMHREKQGVERKEKQGAKHREKQGVKHRERHGVEHRERHGVEHRERHGVEHRERLGVEQNEKQDVEHREKQGVEDVESHGDGKNERKGSSSSSSTRISSHRNKVNISAFDHRSYKVHRCKIKNCKLKDACLSYHDSCDRRRDPKIYKYKPSRCKNVHFTKPSKCPKGDSCGLGHSSMEIRYHPWFYKKYPCKLFMTTGHCSKGNRCEDNHKIDAELPPDEVKLKETGSKTDLLKHKSVREMDENTILKKGHLYLKKYKSLTEQNPRPLGRNPSTVQENGHHHLQDEALQTSQIASLIHPSPPQGSQVDTMIPIQTNSWVSAAARVDFPVRLESFDEVSSVESYVSEESAFLPPCNFSACNSHVNGCRESLGYNPKVSFSLDSVTAEGEEVPLQYMSDNFVIRCFEQLMKVRHLLVFGLSELISNLYSKIKLRAMRYGCLKDFLATKEHCVLLCNVIKQLSQFTSMNLDENLMYIKESLEMTKTFEMTKTLHKDVINVLNKKTYLGLDVSAIAKHTAGEDMIHIVKYVKDVLIGMGKMDVDNTVIVKICKKVKEIQSKMVLHFQAKMKGSTDEIGSRKCSTEESTVVASERTGLNHTSMVTRYDNDNSHCMDVHGIVVDKGSSMDVHASVQRNDIEKRISSLELPSKSDQFPQERRELTQPLCDIDERISSNQFSGKSDPFPQERNELTWPMSNRNERSLCEQLSPTQCVVDDVMGEKGPASRQTPPAKSVLLPPDSDLVKLVCERTNGNHSVTNSELEKLLNFIHSSNEKDISRTQIPNSQVHSRETAATTSSSDGSSSMVPTCREQLDKVYRNEGSINNDTHSTVKSNDYGRRDTENPPDGFGSLISINKDHPHVVNGTSNFNGLHLTPNKKSMSSKNNLNGHNVSGLNVGNIIKELVPATAGLNVPETFDYTEKFFKYAGKDVDKKILNYICRKVCNFNLEASVNKEPLKENAPILMFGNRPSNEKETSGTHVRQDEFSKQDLLRKPEPLHSNAIPMNLDTSIPLLLPTSSRGEMSKDLCEVRNNNPSLINPSKAFIHSESDFLRGMAWESPDIVEREVSMRRKLMPSPICIDDSPEPVILTSPEYSPGPSIIKSPEFSPGPSVIKSPEYSPEPVTIIKSPEFTPKQETYESPVFTSRFKRKPFPVYSPGKSSKNKSSPVYSTGKSSEKSRRKLSPVYSTAKSSEKSKRKRISPGHLPGSKQPRIPRISEACITIPSSPEDNWD